MPTLNAGMIFCGSACFTNVCGVFGRKYKWLHQEIFISFDRPPVLERYPPVLESYMPVLELPASVAVQSGSFRYKGLNI